MASSAQERGALAAAVAGAAADLSRGLSSISPAEQMAIVEAAQRAARESDGGMLIARNHSSDEATVGSWVSSMEAVWGSLAALETRAQHKSSNPDSSGAVPGTAGAAAVSGAEGSTPGSSEDSSAQHEQQEQVGSPAEQKQLQPAVATKAS